MPQIFVDLKITKDQLLKFYSGHAKNVRAMSLCGRQIQFPVEILRPYVKNDGIYDTFAIEYDASGKFVDIKRIC